MWYAIHGACQQAARVFAELVRLPFLCHAKGHVPYMQGHGTCRVEPAFVLMATGVYMFLFCLVLPSIGIGRAAWTTHVPPLVAQDFVAPAVFCPECLLSSMACSSDM